ncbi:MAG: TetR/AcrR family transcriptional regulator [Acidimicrobiia bacterium]
MILDTATELFSEQGFSETGIDEIGAAVGITGPAVYRHFAGKHALLVAVIERSVQHLQDAVEQALADASSPDDALRRLVHFSVDACIDDRALTAIYWQERRNLPVRARSRIDRLHRLMVDEWVGVLRPLRPDLSESETRMCVHAASALMQSVANRETSIGRDRLHDLLSSMTLAALLGENPPSRNGARARARRPAVRSRAVRS